MKLGTRVILLTAGAFTGVVLLIALVAVLPVPDGSRSAADTIYRMLASVAIIVGGSIAYLRFVSGRELQHKLELTVSASVERSTAFSYPARGGHGEKHRRLQSADRR